MSCYLSLWLFHQLVNRTQSPSSVTLPFFPSTKVSLPAKCIKNSSNNHPHLPSMDDVPNAPLESFWSFQTRLLLSSVRGSPSSNRVFAVAAEGRGSQGEKKLFRFSRNIQGSPSFLALLFKCLAGNRERRAVPDTIPAVRQVKAFSPASRSFDRWPRGQLWLWFYLRLSGRARGLTL